MKSRRGRRWDANETTATPGLADYYSANLQVGIFESSRSPSAAADGRYIIQRRRHITQQNLRLTAPPRPSLSQVEVPPSSQRTPANRAIAGRRTARAPGTDVLRR